MGEGIIVIAFFSNIVLGIGSVFIWFWGIFKDFVDMIVFNDFFLWMVIFVIVVGIVGFVIKVVWKFGIKGCR